MTAKPKSDTLVDIDASLSLWDSVLVWITQERCPNILGTLSQIGKNHHSHTATSLKVLAVQKTTVGDVLASCKECGLGYEVACSMTQEEMNRLVYPESFGPKQVKEEPDWEKIHARLQSSRKMNLHLNQDTFFYISSFLVFS